MRQQVRSFVVGIVRHHESLWVLVILACFQVIASYQLKDLGSLAARGCAHVEHRVIGTNVAQNWWHHADNLLASEQASVIGQPYELVNSFQALILFEQLLGNLHLVDEVPGVVWLAVHF